MFCVPLKAYLVHADEALDFVKASLACQLAMHPELSPGECLRQRTFLRALVTAENMDFLEYAADVVEHDGAGSLEALRGDLHRIMTVRHGRILQEKEDGNAFRFEVDAQNRCYFHIRNARMPDSFLEDDAYVISQFRRIMETAEKEFQCRELFTATWLNSVERFCHFMPEEWRENMETLPADNVGPTLGWQGQFINRRGLLNRKTADYYLAHGVLQYPRAASFCTFEAMRAHLDQLENAAG